MPFLTEVHFQNYRSFLNAECRLSPVTVVIGANNAGKSNFLRGVGLAGISSERFGGISSVEKPDVQHFSDGMQKHPSQITIKQGAKQLSLKADSRHEFGLISDDRCWSLGRSDEFEPIRVGFYSLDPRTLGQPEDHGVAAEVKPSGQGLTTVLRLLADSAPEKFKELTAQFAEFVPEIEELRITKRGNKEFEILWHLSASQSGFFGSVPISELSPGTRIILALLTIIHQPNRPELILLEDIEHAIHPRGIAPLIETMRRISAEHGVQFIFTSQHPYVLDCFRAKEHWGDVVIVEKKNGVSRLANMDDRLKRLHYEEEMDQVRLSELWYSGLMGGVADPPPAWDDEP